MEMWVHCSGWDRAVAEWQVPPRSVPDRSVSGVRRERGRASFQRDRIEKSDAP